MQDHPLRRNPGTDDDTTPESQAAPGSVPALAAQPPGPGRNGAELGAPPSNTAPDNSNKETFKALRWGVDSLYLSYSGELHADVQARLKSLKAMAQGKDREEQSTSPPFGVFFGWHGMNGSGSILSPKSVCWVAKLSGIDG